MPMNCFGQSVRVERYCVRLLTSMVYTEAMACIQRSLAFTTGGFRSSLESGDFYVFGEPDDIAASLRMRLL